MDNPEIIDEMAIQRLHRIGGDELVGELIAIFLKNTPERLASAFKGADTGNMSQVLIAAHSLKSSCANLGAKKMRELAIEIEKIALDGNTTVLPGLIKKLEAAFHLARPSLEYRAANPPHRPRIAIIEDNADNRLLVRVILETTYDVSEFETGVEALAKMHTHAPDLVLLDISLPDLDGYAILNAIRADPVLAKVPVIALTAHAMKGDRAKILAAGFDEYVAKPIDDETILLGSIAQLLKQ
jgi:two-component system cell cycle response regulator DivK